MDELFMNQIIDSLISRVTKDAMTPRDFDFIADKYWEQFGRSPSCLDQDEVIKWLKTLKVEK